MICDFIMLVPLIIPILAFINITIIKISEIKGDFLLKAPFSQWAHFQFNTRTPFYFNYWVICIVVAIVISLILLILKKHTLCKTGVALVLNIIAGIMIAHIIISKMQLQLLEAVAQQTISTCKMIQTNQ